MARELLGLGGAVLRDRADRQGARDPESVHAKRSSGNAGREEDRASAGGGKAARTNGRRPDLPASAAGVPALRARPCRPVTIEQIRAFRLGSDRRLESDSEPPNAT